MTVTLFMQLIILSSVLLGIRMILKDLQLMVERKRESSRADTDDYAASISRKATLDFLSSEIDWVRSMTSTIEDAHSRDIISEEAMRKILDGLSRQTELLSERTDQLSRELGQ